MFNKKLKQENARLTQELLDVKQELLYYQNENRVLRDKKDYCDKQVILLNAQVFDLKERLKQTDFDELNKKLAFSRQELTKINEECHNKSIELNQLKTDLVCLTDKIYYSRTWVIRLAK